MTLIVADDDRSIGEGLRHALAGRPADVEFASDVATAKALLDTQRFCGLVLDLMLDGGSGLDVLEHLQARRMAIPTVIVSNMVPGHVREMLDAENVKLVFPRPIEARLLASVVLGLCGIAL